jgi:signal transduction histidine kinase
MQNALWFSAVLSLYPKQLTRKSLSFPVLLMFSVVIGSISSHTAILTSQWLTITDAVSSFVVFTAFVLWLLQWRLSKIIVGAFFLHGCSQWIWRSVWFTPLAGTQIATLLAFPVWRSLLLLAWIRLVSAMVERAEASLKEVATAVEQLKLPNPLNTFEVMISSTLKDLGRERDAAEVAILGMHLSRFRAEKLGSVGLSPRELCELMAKECDILVLIIGERYGHIIEPEGISVVEFEYNVARDHDHGKILVYVKDVLRDDKQLIQFLERVQKFNDGHVMWSFSTPEQLAEQIPPDIMRWLTSHVKPKNN